MGAFARYLRQHPWQRRVLTCSLAAIVGLGAGMAALPIIRDEQVVRMLASADPARRELGIDRAAERGAGRPRLIRRLERRLDAADDTEFSAIAEALARLDRFRAPMRSEEQIDRRSEINLAAAAARPGTAGLRLILTNDLILGGRDNPHVRRGCLLAAGDQEGEIRRAAGVLAARLGDDATLGRLLGDADPAVRAAAAMDAGLGGRIACVKAVEALFAPERTAEERSAAAVALAYLDRGKIDGAIAAAIASARAEGKGDLLERLLHVATLLGPEVAGRAVTDVLAAAEGEKKPASAMALVAAGQMKLPAAASAVEVALEGLLGRKPEALTVADAELLTAAVYAGGRVGLRAARYAQVMQRLWHPLTSAAMVLAAEHLPDSLEGPSDPPEDPAWPREEILEMLERAAEQETMPVPAAAAAAALFRIDPARAEGHLRVVCGFEAYLAGDYVTWAMARSPRREEARGVAARFFGPPAYDRSVRSNGAMLLALLARGTDQAGEVAEAIEGRLRGAGRGPERDPFVKGSYHCALLILGRREHAGEVVALAETDLFPKRRALTALVLAGEPAGLDRVLAAARFDERRVDEFLAGRLMARVYAALIPRLPPVLLAAPAGVRAWQERICRDFYLIRRREVLERTSAKRPPGTQVPDTMKP